MTGKLKDANDMPGKVWARYEAGLLVNCVEFHNERISHTIINQVKEEVIPYLTSDYNKDVARSETYKALPEKEVRKGSEINIRHLHKSIESKGETLSMLILNCA